MGLGILRLCAFALLLAGLMIGSATDPAWSGKTGELVMFDSKACTVCRKFEAEVGDDYLDSKAAQIFPLRRIDIYKGTVDFKLAQPVTMTPTFVFIGDGEEIVRFVGYPGRKHFFTLVDAAAEEYSKIPEQDPQKTTGANPATPR